MTEVTPHPLKTQGFHHFFILLFYDHPANDVTIMKEGHPEAGTPLFWWVRLELNQRCFRCHGFTDRCDRQLRALTHMAESAELEFDTVRCDPLSLTYKNHMIKICFLNIGDQLSPARK